MQTSGKDIADRVREQRKSIVQVTEPRKESDCSVHVENKGITILRICKHCGVPF